MIILTGFERFGRFIQNLSESITNDFPNEFQNVPIMKKILPVSWRASLELYATFLNSLERLPSLIIMTGIHTGKKIRIERYGWNIAFGLDNENRFKIGFINLRGPMRVKTIANLKKIISFLKNQKNTELSSYPGSFLCNYIYYWALCLAKRKYPVIFIHVPSKDNIDSLKEDFENIVKIIIDQLLED